MISSILLVALFIGLLITFHEFGHLIVAKIVHIPVEVFSVGFGPTLLKHKWGETEYRLSVIPLGGYIKMLGEEAEAAGGFSERSFGVKAAVIAAGPVFNLILGFVMLLAMYLAFGIRYMAPVLDIPPDSPALAAGFQTGDVVVRAAGDTVPDFETFEDILASSPGQEIAVTVLRNGAFVERTYEIPAEPGDADTALVPVVSEIRSGSPADLAGIQPGDTIVAVQGRPVTDLNEFADTVRRNPGRRLHIAWRSEGALLEDTVTPEVSTDPLTGKKVGQVGASFDLPRPDFEPLVAPVVDRVRRGSPAASIGLRTGDTIVALAGSAILRWDDFLDAVGDKGGEQVAISWRRDGRLFTDSVTPVLQADQFSGAKTGQIGIWVGLPRRNLPLHVAVWQALNRTGYIVVQTFVIVYKVATRQIAGRAIGGPLMVAKVAYEGASWGAEYFIALWALLSVNLFVVNMLPIPVLDGGRILLFGFEAVRRRRLTERELGWAMNIGWAIIGLILILVLFNDITRLVGK